MKINRASRAIIAPAAYFVISLIATWPLITHLRGWVPGFGDWGQNMWALWWTRHALLTLEQLPFFTNYLFYPEGITLLFHPLDVSDGLLALPLYGHLGGDISYNVMVLLSFLLSGWGAYLLALYLIHHRGAGFVAGLVFMLAPYHFLRIDLGHLNLSTVQWIPFYVLFILKFIQQGNKRDGALAIFLLAFTALNSWYYVIYGGLLSLALIFWPATAAAFKSAFSQRLGRISLVLGISIIILLPFLVPMLNLLNTTTFVGEHNALRHSVDLYSFWVPGPPSTWANWFEDVWISYAAQNREPGASAYMGYTVIILSIIGLIGKRWRWQAIWWLVVALGFTVLAMGPYLQINGQILNVPLPYQLLTQTIPAFQIAGIPGRFVVITSLALAVLSAYGVTTTGQWLSQRSRINQKGWQKHWFWVAISLLILVEYAVVPLRLTATDVDEFYHTLGAETDTYAILDIKWDANFLLHAQTVHNKPLVGGWLARLPEAQAAYLNQSGLDNSFLYLLLGPEGVFTDPAAIPPAIRQALAQRNVRYIITHDNMAGQFLEQIVGWPVIYRGDNIMVYGDKNR